MKISGSTIDKFLNAKNNLDVEAKDIKNKMSLFQSFEVLEQENQKLKTELEKVKKVLEAKTKMANGLRETVEFQNTKLYQLQVQLNQNVPMLTRSRMQNLDDEITLLRNKLAITEQRFQEALKHIPFDQHLAIYNSVPESTVKGRKKR